MTPTAARAGLILILHVLQMRRLWHGEAQNLPGVTQLMRGRAGVDHRKDTGAAGTQLQKQSSR